ncbi:MAG: ribosome biogenesis GTPase Der [Chloroflexi bacterium]|nr:ribosome biogenesis GTPase Der [Chloroflexota bacterium]
MALPIVAIIGRPNVGKSTLFNRLAGRRIAIVSDIPGTTRDRVSTDARWRDLRFILVDTGGIDPRAGDAIYREVQAQTASAIEDADVMILVTDASEGVTAGDRDAVDQARRSGKPVVLAANKAESERRALATVEFYELGLGDPLPISAYHGHGIDELMEKVAESLPAEIESEEPERVPRVAIVGRTNVGKSALLNAIAGKTRSIVSPIPGTTRDPVDTLYRYKEQDLLFIDTAGLRRRGHIEPGIEKYSALRTIQAIERCYVAILVLDASEFVTAQDTHIAGYIEDAGRGAVIVVNKWDLAPELNLETKDVERSIRRRLQFLDGAPIRFTSAIERTGIPSLLSAIVDVHEQWRRTLEPEELRRVLMEALAAHPPPSEGRRETRIYRVVQRRTGPPTFVFHTSDPDRIHFSYRRYLENCMRQAFGFEGAPLKLEFVSRR